MRQRDENETDETPEGTDRHDRLFGVGGIALIGCGASDCLADGPGATYIDGLSVDRPGGSNGPLARERGTRAALRQSVLDLIVHRADDPDFDPMQAAEQLGISVRYLHRLLEPSGRTFLKHLIERRLGRAFEILRDPAFGHLKIDAVARDTGFSDISHFNRSFRRAFGDTPYGVRVRSARARG